MSSAKNYRKKSTSRSGLELLQAIINGTASPPNMGKTLGFHLVHAEDGKTIFEGCPESHVINPAGTVHGGWYGALLDSCMGCAVHSKINSEQIYTTLEYKVSLIRAISLGTRVRAIGTVQHAGRSTGIANGEIRGIEDDRLYATGSTTCIIMAAPAIS
ncbi:PaaI family thioesterase [Pseudopelagicola sp. nBUS_19]|uniref:PaaI family thioesterase n=1 Tax=Pseudopelagicola sp. nBUS_19 TaxID=3395316 RepID=UPI003EBD1A6C